MEKPFVLCLDLKMFKEWLTNGVTLFEFEMNSKLLMKDFLQNDGLTQPIFFIKVPNKYNPYIKDLEPFLFLIDEIDQISLATESLTSEWFARFDNLGESWLPFKFSKDLLDCFVFSVKQKSVKENKNSKTKNTNNQIEKENMIVEQKHGDIINLDDSNNISNKAQINTSKKKSESQSKTQKVDKTKKTIEKKASNPKKKPISEEQNELFEKPQDLDSSEI